MCVYVLKIMRLIDDTFIPTISLLYTVSARKIQGCSENLTTLFYSLENRLLSDYRVKRITRNTIFCSKRNWNLKDCCCFFHKVAKVRSKDIPKLDVPN